MENSMPYRIISSSRGLAHSAISSFGRFDSDFKDIWTPGKQRQASSRRLSGCSEAAQTKTRSGVAKRQRPSGAFRTSGPTTFSSQKLEADFEEFANSKIHGLEKEYEEVASYAQSRMLQDRNDIVECGVSGLWEGEREKGASSRAPISSYGTDQDLSMDMTGLTIGDFESSQHATAARRIALVSDQMDRVSVLQWQVSEQARMLAEKVHYHQREGHCMKNRSSSLEAQTPLNEVRLHQSPSQEVTRENQTDEDIEDGPLHDFHCPYLGCLETFAWNLWNTSADQQQKACVHYGCDYVSENVVSWREHVLSAHHDLQNGIVDE